MSDSLAVEANDSTSDLAQEIEIKLVGAIEPLLRHPLLAGKDTCRRLEARYFDTADWRLSGSGASLRIRATGGRFEQTLKTADAPGAVVRSEWNVTAAGEAPTPGAFPKDAQERLAALLGDGALVQFATVKTDRTVRQVSWQDAEIEFAFDNVVIEAGSRSGAFAEMELELKHGTLADLIALVQLLPSGPDLQWSLVTKAQRAVSLASGLRTKALKAPPVSLPPGTTAEQGFQRIAWSCLAHLIANYRLVADAGDAEALHQCRVALRRLRAALSLFRRLVADDRFEALRRALRDTASELGPARELDVLTAAVERHGEDDLPVDRLQALAEAIEKARVRAYDKAAQLLSGADFQQLLFATAHWIEAGAWREAASAELRTMPVERFGADILRRRRRKLRKAARHLADMDVAERHRLRIQVKKLRYATDFLADIARSDGKALRRTAFSDALSSLQDKLGALNDMNVDYGAHLPGLDSPPMHDLLQQLLAGQRKSEKKLLDAAVRAAAQAMTVRRFWPKD